MPSIEVDIVFFVLTVIVAFISLPLILIWAGWKSYKNPEFWLKLRKQDWFYALVRNMGTLLQIAVPYSRLRENGEFTLFKGSRTFYWKDKYFKESKPGEQPDPKNGLPTTFLWRHEKMGALYDISDPMPQVWVPGNSLTSMTDPAFISSLKEMKILQLLMNADPMTSLMRMSLILMVIAIIAVAGLAFAVWTGSQDTANGLSHILKFLNSTRTGP